MFPHWSPLERLSDEEEQADIKKVDECKGSYQKIGLKKNDLDWKIENNKAKVQTHEKAIAAKTEAKKATIKDMGSNGGKWGKQIYANSGYVLGHF